MTTLSLVTDVGRANPFFSLLEDWADDVALASAGDLTIQLFGAGELVGAFEVTDAVASGLVDIGWTSPAFTPGLFPDFAGFDVPFEVQLGADHAEAAWRTINDTGIDPASIDILATSFAGDSHLYIQSPIETAADFFGLKLRAQGVNALILEELGASPVNFPSAELFQAIASGVIDGASLSSSTLPAVDASLGGTLLVPDDGQLLSPLLRTLFINEDALSGLSAEDRAALIETTGLDLSREFAEATRLLNENAVAATGLPVGSFGSAALSAYQVAVEAYFADNLSPSEQSVRDQFQSYLNGNPSDLPSDGNDDLDGSTSAELISALGGDDTVNGRDGNDTIFGGGGNDSLVGGLGNDEVSGGTGDDTISGGDGSDLLRGNRGQDTINGGLGDDSLRGQREADNLIGGSGDDNIKGGGGNDTLDGGTGSDFLKGGTRVDVLFGGAGNDLLRGNSFNDTLNGGEGRDTLNGGGDDDALLGGTGDDRLIGASGDDTLSGGDGADVFVFRIGGHGVDTITDFDLLEDKLLVNSGKNVEQIVSEAQVLANGVAISLERGDLITLEGITDKDGLESVFEFF